MMECYEEAYKILREMKSYCSDKILIVEGTKDREALEAIGLNLNILVIKNGDSLERMIERLEGVDEVIILTDFDPQGVELAYKIMSRLESVGVKVNLTYWLKLRNLLKREIKDIEGLRKLLEILPSI
ncbi:MAG: toprim domain-containing protein [Nitrososphaerota archaeon]|nr:toprim domain-containing protein [Candidatus Bathyarchaeota archaeon]MCX8162256.1 toprim domain-containing protein [Candidatus Bathyarchaeota archaeon]MDW8062338.1 toprim domain-containing protein [Nitrososphaerota archaeon]